MRLVVLLLLLASAAAFAQAPVGDLTVKDEAEALALYARARGALASLGLVIPREVPLKYRTRDELNTENVGRGGLTIELDGFYCPYNPEEIWIVSGLTQEDTFAAMCHEWTHAWQSTEAPLQDRKLKEGFARWVEYHALKSAGRERAAEALTFVRDPDYGGGLRYLLEVERKSGRGEVLRLARTATRIP